MFNFYTIKVCNNLSKVKTFYIHLLYCLYSIFHKITCFTYTECVCSPVKPSNLNI